MSLRASARTDQVARSPGIPGPTPSAARPPRSAGRVDTSTPALVLSAQNYGCLGIIRSLGRLGVDVFAVDADPGLAASRSRYLRDRFVFDMKTATPEATVDYLLDVGKRIGRPTILFPTWDQTALLASEYQDVLSERYLFPRQPPGLAESLADKKTMDVLARSHSVPTPGLTLPMTVEEVEAFADQAAFPVVLKGIDGNLLKARTGLKMVIVERPDELVKLYRQMEDPDNPNLMLQEYIPGGENDVWMFNGYFDGQSECLVGFTGRKLRQTPVYTGVTSLGVCEANEVVRGTTIRWMKELGYRGILDIGYRYDARDGLYKVLDVNPRIGATFRLFVGRDGLDVSRALYLDLTGQAVPPSVQVEGRKWMVEGADIDSALRYRRDGKLTMPQWAGSLKGVRETAYFARDDLAPFVDASLGFLWRKTRREASDAAPTDGHGALPQDLVDRHFTDDAEYWKDVYDRGTVDGITYRRRNSTALRWIDDLRLPDGANVLDIGSGAGLTSVALAERGYRVTATDTVPAMRDYTSQLARDRGVADRVSALIADACDLPFEAGSFDLVVALGLLPWLDRPWLATDEMMRVLRPGGHVLISIDNTFRLADWLDPVRNPVLVAARGRLGDVLRAARIRRSPKGPVLSHRHRPGEVEAVLARQGSSEVRSTTVGFGPMTFLGRPVVSERASVRLDATLQGLADRRVPVVRDLGAHWVVLARKASETETRSEADPGRNGTGPSLVEDQPLAAGPHVTQ